MNTLGWTSNPIECLKAKSFWLSFSVTSDASCTCPRKLLMVLSPGKFNEVSWMYVCVFIGVLAVCFQGAFGQWSWGGIHCGCTWMAGHWFHWLPPGCWYCWKCCGRPPSRCCCGCWSPGCWPCVSLRSWSGFMCMNLTQTSSICLVNWYQLLLATNLHLGAKYCPYCSLGPWLVAFISVAVADFTRGLRCCWPELEGVCIDGVSFGEDLKSLWSDSETSCSISVSVEVGRGTLPILMLPVINKWSFRKPKLRIIHCSLSVYTFWPCPDFLMINFRNLVRIVSSQVSSLWIVIPSSAAFLSFSVILSHFSLYFLSRLIQR